MEALHIGLWLPRPDGDAIPTDCAKCGTAIGDCPPDRDWLCDRCYAEEVPDCEVQQAVARLQALQHKTAEERLADKEIVADWAISVWPQIVKVRGAVPEWSDNRKVCTCVGTCRGKDWFGEGWRCALEALPADPIGNPAKYTNVTHPE